MADSDDVLQSARARIDAAYDPAVVRAAAHRFADLIAGHLSQVQAGETPVLNWAEPTENIARAGALLDQGDGLTGPGADELVERFGCLVAETLARGQNLHSPRYLGHQVPAPLPLAGLFDAVGAVTNQVMTIYEMGPWTTGVERALIDRLLALVGWSPETSAGLVTHGGSIANLTALLTARNVMLPHGWDQGLGDSASSGVLITHPDAHYSIARAAGLLGLGTNQVLRAEVDAGRRIDPLLLDQRLARVRSAGQRPLAVVACACATAAGQFDPLVEIAEVCRRHEVWLHVDAAHGGAALLSRTHRHLMKGLDQADSIVWDAHKMLFVPALCAFVLYRNRVHRFETFRQDAPYLFDPSAPGMADYDGGMLTLECTKRAAALGLWGVWSLYGARLFEDLVDVTFDLGRRLYEKLAAADDFETLHEPQCNIVAFRHLPAALAEASADRVGAFQLELRKVLVRSGRFYIVPTRWNGVAALRTTLINPLTRDAHLDALLDELRTQGRRLLEEGTWC